MATDATFYFAWVSSAETEFNESHLREDELIFSFELKHEEGQVAELELEIINPHIGLLAPGRPLWAWFAWSGDGETAIPLFFGRLIGIPDDLFADVIKIKLVAKPKDYVEQRAALAADLAVLPFFDPIFVDERKLDDPDTVLEGYSKLWHVDRTTHEVTVSDIIGGEDGVAEFTPNDVFYDSVRVKVSGAPLLVCDVDASVQWVQCDHTGVLEFKTVRGLTGNTDLGKGLTVKKGVVMGDAGGNFFQSGGFKQTTYSWSGKNTDDGPHANGDMMSHGGSVTIPFISGFLTSRSISYTSPDESTGTGEEYSISESFKADMLDPSQPPDDGSDGSDATNNDIEIGTEVEQDRAETIHVRVLADVQPVLTEAFEDDDDIKEQVSMDARDVVAAGAASPSDGAYFPTDRGMQSIEYLLMVARAHLLAGSRVVETEWECPFDKAVGLSCRMAASIEDSRLPGGIVLGKIVSYTMTGDGDDGEFIGRVTINSAVGYGNAIELADGTPDYVEVGYVDPGYQHYTGRLVAALTNDMAFEPLGYEAIGIQLPISADQVLIRHEYNRVAPAETPTELIRAGTAQLGQLVVPPPTGIPTGPPAEAIAYGNAMMALDDAVSRAVADNPSWVEMEFAPVQGIETSVNYEVVTTALVIPKQIDLAAPSTP